MRRCVLAMLFALGWGATSASAVVHANGDGLGNTTAPPDDPGFAHVGHSPNGMSGVYVGNGWVLTAAHVGETSFTFAGRSYPPVVGSRVRLVKDGVSADLAMLRLAGPPPALPEMTLATAPPAVDDPITMVGHGWSRAATPTCWEIGWVEVACPGGAYRGYHKGGDRVVRWGVNRVSTPGIDVATGGKLTRSLATLFDADGEPDEAQLVKGDSGGAAFLKRDGTWELVGIPFAASAFGAQPKNTAVFGNTSYIADVHFYRDEIESLRLTSHHVPALPIPFGLVTAALLLATTGRARLR